MERAAEAHAAASVKPEPASAGLDWLHGPCSGANGAERQQRLAEFRPVGEWTSRLFIHPEVPEVKGLDVSSVLYGVRAWGSALFGLRVTQPDTYVYPSVAALQQGGCAPSFAVAYYDGAIHLAVADSGTTDELFQTLKHEYVHHALISNGVREPFWLQEGLALRFALEYSFARPSLWREHPASEERMVAGLPKDATLEQASALYAQAYAMAHFVDQLCSGLPDCNAAELVAALRGRRATPETLFDWAVQRRGQDLLHTARLSLWDDFVERGSIPGPTLDALYARPPAKHD